MDPFGITERVVDFSIDRISGFIKPNAAERAAAFELLVELSTRTTVAPLASDEGLLREALSSIYLIFGETRALLRKHGPEVAKERNDGNVSLAVLAVRVLNDVLRPTLSKWHPRLEAHEAGRPSYASKADWERKWEHAAQCRADLNALRESVRAYIDTLGRVAGAPGLAEAALPSPASKALGQETVDDAAAKSRAGDRPRQHMVPWFDPLELARLLRAHFRQGHVASTDPGSGFEVAGKGEDFWLDYVADLADAFDPTMAVAWQVGRRSITLPRDRTSELPEPPEELPRADLLVFGGDTVYPSASKEGYHQQLVLPYRMAWETAVPTGDEKPSVVAIPGNHDWLGGIDHFESIFTNAEVFAEHWRAPQQAPWFAAKLPHHWWLWGIDTGTDPKPAGKQDEYFKAAAAELAAGDRVIVCTPVPLWQLRQRKPRQYFELRSYIDALVRANHATIPLFLSGDSHYFAHYRRQGVTEEHHVTAGGGGAFLHPTHNLPERIPYERGTAEFALTRRWPSAADSRALTFRWRDLFSRQFLLLLPVFFALHMLYGALVAVPSTVGVRPAVPEGGWSGPLIWTIQSWPGWLYLVLLLFPLVAFLSARPNSYEPLLVRRARMWGAIQGFVQVAVFVGVASSGRGLRWDLPWWHVVPVPLFGAVVSMVTFMLLMTSVNTKIKAGDNGVFSAVHSTRYKHFLRMRIGSDGRLTLFVVGLDPVGEHWFEALDTEPRLVPPYDPDGEPRMHYVWGTTI